MKLSILTITLCSALALVGCKKKGNTAESGSGSAAITGSGSATITGSGSATMTGSGSAAMTGSGGAASAGKSELASATWNNGGKLAAPLGFDRQLWSDDGNGNLQMFLIARCPKAPDECALLKYDNLQHEDLDKICPGWTMIHIVFNPKKDQKAHMGPLPLKPGAYGGDSEPVALGMIEYTDKNDGNPGTVGGQIYPKEPSVVLTEASDTLAAGTFDAKDGDYAYKGSFSAKKCTCDENVGTCK